MGTRHRYLEMNHSLRKQHSNGPFMTASYRDSARLAMDAAAGVDGPGFGMMPA
jgi:hypothetical protein